MPKNNKIYDKNKNERGAALMMALFFFTVASFIVTQLSTETLTESMLASREMKKLKSKYSANAGLEMALLRIKAFQQAKAAVRNATGNQSLNFDQQLAMIWQFPLPWPIELPDGAGIISKDDNEKVLKKSLISSLTFFHEIQDAGQKIDLNSLGSPIENIAKKTLDSLLLTFERALETDKELSKEHSMDSIREILNNIADWVDKDDESRNGGDESSFYSFEEQRGYPRNASFMTLSELMLIDKMDDLVFNKLKNIITVHGTFGINVNTAEKDVLMGIDAQFTEQVTKDFITKRSEIQENGDNLDEASFDSLLSELGFSEIDEIHTKGVPILYSPLSTFLITSTGTVGNISTTIKASVLDANALKEIFIEQLDKDATSDTNGSTAPSGSNSSSTTPTHTAAATSKKVSPPPKGKPLVLHMSID